MQINFLAVFFEVKYIFFFQIKKIVLLRYECKKNDYFSTFTIFLKFYDRYKFFFDNIGSLVKLLNY